MGSGLVGLNLKSVLTGEEFTISRTWLTLEGAVPFVKALEYRKYKRRMPRLDSLGHVFTFGGRALPFSPGTAFGEERLPLPLASAGAPLTFGRKPPSSTCRTRVSGCSWRPWMSWRWRSTTPACALTATTSSSTSCPLSSWTPIRSYLWGALAELWAHLHWDLCLFVLYCFGYCLLAIKTLVPGCICAHLNFSCCRWKTNLPLFNSRAVF